MGMAAENAVAFGVNEALKRAFPDESKADPNQRPDLLKPFAMGTMTGCCSAMVLLPSEIVKVRPSVGLDARVLSKYERLTRVFIYNLHVNTGQDTSSHWRTLVCGSSSSNDETTGN
jgi:hypothetical protein